MYNLDVYGLLSCFTYGKNVFIVTSSSFGDLSALDNLAVICPLKKSVRKKYLLNILWQGFLIEVQVLFHCTSASQWDAVMSEICLGFDFFFKLGDYAYFMYRL